MPTAQCNSTLDMIIRVGSDPVSVVTSAAAAITSPWWLPFYQEISNDAGSLLPILGCVLAALQIVFLTGKLLGWWDHHGDD